MVNTKFGELPREAVVGVYMKVHSLHKEDVVVSVMGGFLQSGPQQGWAGNVYL